jgi:hypothetical protein
MLAGPSVVPTITHKIEGGEEKIEGGEEKDTSGDLSIVHPINNSNCLGADISHATRRSLQASQSRDGNDHSPAVLQP